MLQNHTEGCLVDHSLFDALGGNGVWLTDYNRNTTIVANELRFLGENGIGLTGEYR
jgi:hypothetical protein